MRTAFALAGAASLALASQGPMDEMFREFKLKFAKKYGSDAEEMKRFSYFVRNMQSAAHMMQLEGATAQYGHLSPMADMSEEEFTTLNNLPVTPQLIAEHASKAVSVQLRDDAPTNFDWRDKGAVTPVKNQGQCGSCWAFSTIANIEGQMFNTNGKLISLSEQEIVDCSDSDHGCQGGLPSRAYDDLIKSSSGIELENVYPAYSATNGNCRAEKSKEVVFLECWMPISQDEDQIAAALVKYGPLSIALNAGPMQMYMGGISDPWFCSPSGIDHAVTLTGYGEEDGKQFWSIKNSWGDGWGEKGYYRLIRGKGKCGMNRVVTSATVKKQGADIFV